MAGELHTGMPLNDQEFPEVKEWIYFPKHLSAHDRAINCICMCHEQGPATEHGQSERCPCKTGGKR